MNAYFVAVALEHDGTIHASAAIIIPNEDTEDAATRITAALTHPDYVVLARSIAVVQDEVLIALAKLAKEKGLIE